MNVYITVRILLFRMLRKAINLFRRRHFPNVKGNIPSRLKIKERGINQNKKLYKKEGKGPSGLNRSFGI